MQAEIEIQYDSTNAISWHDRDGIVPTSASVSLLTPAGATVSSPTVTRSSISTTTAEGTTESMLKVALATGISRGIPLAVTSDGVAYVVEVSRVDGTSVYLTAPLPLVPDTGSAVKGLRMTATLAAPGVVGDGYRLRWVYASATESRTVTQAAVLVRQLWSPPCTAADVRQVLANTFSVAKSDSYCQSVADTVNEDIRALLLQTGRRPHLYLGAGAFSGVSRKGILAILAERGVCLGGQVAEEKKEARFAFTDAMTALVTSAQQYDSDADGTLSTAERKPPFFTLQMVR